MGWTPWKITYASHKYNMSCNIVHSGCHIQIPTCRSTSTTSRRLRRGWDGHPWKITSASHKNNMLLNIQLPLLCSNLQEYIDRI
jgi:hypothetical protein